MLKKSQIRLQSRGSCAQYAIYHVLLLLGIRKPIWKIFLATKRNSISVRRDGTNGFRIQHAIRRFGCSPVVCSTTSPVRARVKLNSLLRDGSPVILCVENSMHWIVVAGLKGKKYIWIDSADEKKTGACGWHELVDRVDSDDFYFIGVKRAVDIE